MINIDYNAIKFLQFADLLPQLKVSPLVEFDEPELILATFPIWTSESSDVVKHIVCGYKDNIYDNLLLHPFGTIEVEDHPAMLLFDEIDDFLIECVCLVTGRLTSGAGIALSSFCGNLENDISRKFLPHDIQGAGEAIIKKLFANRQFYRAQIGDHFFRTTISGVQKDALKPFLQKAVPPAPRL